MSVPSQNHRASLSLGIFSPCPLCACPDVEFFYEDKKRHYNLCAQCLLVNVPERFWLSEAKERAEYEKHENNPNDEGYRRFLSRLSVPLLETLSPASIGLDFGCGPGPTLSLMLERSDDTYTGHKVALYDKYFYDQPERLEQQYDFICATEVAEHLKQPGKELDRLWSLLKPGGHLGLMTKLVRDREAFSHWHYKNDPTHISFFSKHTMQWLAQRWRATLTIHGADVFIFSRI